MPTIGIDVGGTKVLGIVLGDDGDVEDELRVPTPEGSDALVAAIGSVVARLDASDDCPVGVGAPGLVDRHGTLRVAPNLAGVLHLDLKARLAGRLRRRVAVDNDATCAALAEWQLGAGRGVAEALVITLGTGIGGGIITGGRVQRGANGFAGEFGHMVVDAGGPPCPCGKQGCWERFASGSGLAHLAHLAARAGELDSLLDAVKGDVDAVRGEDVTAAAQAGDGEAQAVLERFGWWVALGLSNLTNAYDPSRFVLAGGLVEMGDLLLGPVRRAYAELVPGARYRPLVEIVPAALGDRAGGMGAALLPAEEPA